MATGITIEFSGDDDEDRKRPTSNQPASKSGQADGVSGRKRKTPVKPVADSSRAELVQQAKDLGIRGYSAMNKTQLQDAINLKLKPPKAKKEVKSKSQVKTTDRRKLTKLISEADANAVQAAKDGRDDAASQWRSVAADYAKELAGLNVKQTKKAIGNQKSPNKVRAKKVKLSETFIPEGTEIDDSFDFGANVKPSVPSPLFDQQAESFSPLPEPVASPTPVEPAPLFDQDLTDFTPLPEPTEFPEFIPGGKNDAGKTVDFGLAGTVEVPISKVQKQLEAKAKKEKNLQDRSSLSQMQRRANVQNSIQKRRETLQRRREREAIAEDAKNSKKDIQDRYDRGDADRLVRRLATFGIGRAVGIDGGMITALAEIMIFQPEINKAEAEVAALLKNADRTAAERLQELERSKTATTERRQTQSIDIAETIDDARARVAMGEDVDMGEVEDRIGSILNRGVVDSGTGIPTPRTGQQAGPGTSVFPTTSQFTTPAQSGAAGTPPPPFVGGSGGMNPPGSPGGPTGGGFGGFGGSPPRGGSPPPGVPGGGAGPGGLAMTTSSLLMLTVGLTAAAKASQIAADGFKSIGELVQDEKNVGKAIGMVGSTASAATTGVATAVGAMFGPVGALAGLVVGKALGSTVINPITEAITVGFDVVASAADKSLGPGTIGSRVNEDITLLLARLEQSMELDDITSDYIEARTDFALAVMDLKTSIIKIIGPAAADIVDLLTTVVDGFNVAFLKGPGQAPGEVSTTQGLPTMTYNLMRIIMYLQGIKDNTDPAATNTNIIGPINDFFQGGRDSRAAVQGSFATNIHPWDLTNNITNFNP